VTTARSLVAGEALLRMPAPRQTRTLPEVGAVMDTATSGVPEAYEVEAMFAWTVQSWSYCDGGKSTPYTWDPEASWAMVTPYGMGKTRIFR
jgi:hypothetical protein